MRLCRWLFCIVLASLLLFGCSGDSSSVQATPTDTPEPVEAPDPGPDGLISWTAGGFVARENMTVTETEYVSDKLHFTVSTVYDTEHFTRPVTYFVTDLYIRDLNCLRTYAASDFTAKNQKQFAYVHTIAKNLYISRSLGLNYLNLVWDFVENTFGLQKSIHIIGWHQKARVTINPVSPT